ncbi:hypothetical protein UA08_04146 [Talaromyces atroroseus]|uniref:Uncharacterized protein n=1 Tax=Talaromyces atroroseus TaxID=1441469 RepID=A0A1Q5Q971_TALAT|nr:hypothetical protein UA08_04146 [Talaromyces atroroseus]OKL60500.1 hypothetical protein UA08_04146 [Talaromyces atroroseus]
MDGPPPPPPPHGANPNTTEGTPKYRKSTDLPDGPYDIFIIPPHSAGSGFLYLPSLQCHRNSFIAGSLSTLLIVAVWTLIQPTVKTWVATTNATGGMGVIVLVLAVGFAGWYFGTMQNDGGANGSSANRPRPGGAAFGGGYQYGAYQNQGGPYQNGGPTPNGGPPPNSHFNSGGHYNHGGASQPPPYNNHNAQPNTNNNTEKNAKGSTPNDDPKKAEAEREKAREEARQREEAEREKAREEARRKEEAEREKAREEARRKEEAEWAKAREETRRKEAEWEKAREETRRKEEIRRKMEAYRKKREAEEAERRRQKEREAMEEELRRRKEELEKEAAAAKAAAEKEVRERAEREAAEREEKARREQAEREERVRKEAAEQEEREKKQAAEKEAAAKEAAKKEAAARFAAAKEAAAKKFAAAKEAAAKAKQSAPAHTAASAPSAAPPRTPSPRKPPPPSTRTAEEDDAYSFRPYDRPRRPYGGTSSPSVYSESSYAPSQSTARTTPPPSHRGPYTTKDPDKVIISGVYLFNNAFQKTPIAQLVSGKGTVTDGLILKITTEGLFIDDDVRGIAQREWDVKAWTLKSVEMVELRGLQIVRFSVRDAEGKRYVFILGKPEVWKVKQGLGRLRRGSQVRALSQSELPRNEGNAILTNLGYA